MATYEEKQRAYAAYLLSVRRYGPDSTETRRALRLVVEMGGDRSGFPPSDTERQRRQAAEYRGNRDRSQPPSTPSSGKVYVPGYGYVESSGRPGWVSDPRQDASGRNPYGNRGGNQSGGFQPDRNAAKKGKPDGPKTVVGDEQGESAYGWFAQFWNELGLPELGKVALEASKSARNVMEIDEAVRNSQEFRNRFPGLIAREKAGLPGMSPAEYLSQERSYREALSEFGMPKGFYDDPSDFANWIANDVSVNEIRQRASMASALAANADPNLKQALKQYYGVTDGDMAAYFLDRKRTTDILEKQIRASEIGAETLRSGILKTGRKFAEGLADAGVNAMQTRAAITDVADEVDTVRMLGDIEGNRVSNKDQVEAKLGLDNNAEQKVRGLKSRERARFGGSGAGTRALGGPDTAGSF